jgi:hypothetical protein
MGGWKGGGGRGTRRISVGNVLDLNTVEIGAAFGTRLWRTGKLSNRRECGSIEPPESCLLSDRRGRGAAADRSGIVKANTSPTTMKSFPRETHLRWRRLDVPGREEARIQQAPAGWHLVGEAEVEESATALQLAYAIDCDRKWRTRRAIIDASSSSGKPSRFELLADGDGHWSVNGTSMSTLDGALDIDLGFTPATNLLPIRRLTLEIGERAEVRTAWLRFPELRVELLEQSYTREDDCVFRYDALVDAQSFTARLETNEFGCVLLYEGLWEAELAVTYPYLRSRIMYIESKAAGLSGPARIGRVTFSKSGKTIYYGGRTFESLKGRGFKSNYRDVDTREEYWISGPHKDGGDRLYGGRDTVDIDPDVRREYWRDIRGQPHRVADHRA